MPINTTYHPPKPVQCHDFVLQMWALSPSIFDLASKHFSPLDEVVSEVYPAVQYALLNTLYSHCSRSANYSYHHTMAGPIISSISLIINLKDIFSIDNVVIFFQWMHTGILHVCCSLKKKNIYIEHIPLVIYFFNYVCFFCFTGNEIKRLFREFNWSFPDSIASKCFWLALSSLDWLKLKRHIWDLVKFSSQKCLYF